MNQNTQVFISYSHQDKEWLNRLQVHLKPLGFEGSVRCWDDTQIASGQDWRREIQTAMLSVKVAVLLVSADFLASDFIRTDELPPLLEAAANRGATILPVIISPCGFRRIKSLERFQAANDPDEPLIGMKRVEQERVFDQIAERIRAILMERAIAWQAAFRAERRNHQEELQAKLLNISADAALTSSDKGYLQLMFRGMFLNKEELSIREELLRVEREQASARATGDSLNVTEYKAWLNEEERRLGSEKQAVVRATNGELEKEKERTRWAIKNAGGAS